MNMEFIPKKLVREWSWRLDTGMPDWENPLHLVELKNLLVERKFPQPFIDALLVNLNEKVGKVYFQGKAPKGAKVMVGPRGGKYYMGNPDTGEPETTKKKEKDSPEKSVKQKRDHEKADKALHMTNSEYKALQSEYKQLKKLGKNRNPEQQKRFKELDEGGIGAGQEKSQAGEAITHKALRMLKEGKSWDQIEKYLTDLVNSDDHVLNSKSGKSWVPAGIAVARKLVDEFGIDNIQNISWDTPEGREAIGVSTDFSTASDMFIVVKNPETGKTEKIGVSLKKDGQVFINNGGWDKQHNKIVESMRKAGVDEQTIKEFEEKCGYGSYQKQYDEALTNGVKSINPNDPDFKNEINKIKSDEAYAKKVFGPNWRDYVDRLEPIDAFLKRLQSGRGLSGGGFSGNDSKAFVKLMQKSTIGEQYPEIYQNMRKADHDLTKRTMEALRDSPKLLEATKVHILNSIHLDEILGLNDRQDGDVDKFITAYGIEPDGVTMDEKTLGKLFGPGFTKMLADVRDGKATRDDLKKFISDNIVVDYENNRINFKQEFPNDNPPPDMLETVYPLWDWHARAKGLGNAPAMELGQDPFLAKSLQEGSPDVRKWHPKTHFNYLTGKITVLKKDIEEAKEIGLPKEEIETMEKQQIEYLEKKKELKNNPDFETSREDWEEKMKDKK